MDTTRRPERGPLAPESDALPLGQVRVGVVVVDLAKRWVDEVRVRANYRTRKTLLCTLSLAKCPSGTIVAKEMPLWLYQDAQYAI